MTHSAPLADVVLDRLAASDLGGPAQDLVLAAVQGDTELDDEVAAQLDAAGAGVRSVTSRTAVAGAARVRVGPVSTEVFLRSMTVAGFRGIGPRATLDLAPGPGLTVVAGRNGSGKSSFAEAAEVALTGTTARWAGGGTVARGGWRNLHVPDPAEVALEVTVTGSATATTVRRSWAPAADLAAAIVTAQVHGRPRAPLSDLGWDEVLVTHRPFLSHAELSTLADDRPSAMFDAIRAILGLEELTEAEARLKRAKTDVEAQAGAAKNTLSDLRGALAHSVDDRAVKVTTLLGRKTPDLDAIAALATGTAPGTGPDLLDALVDLRAPDPAAVAHAVGALRVASTAIHALDGTPAGDARRLAGLLRAGLEHHTHVGDGACPLCGAGELDDGWRARVQAEVERLDRVATDAESTAHALELALRAARQLVAPVPGVLAAPAPSTDGRGLDPGPARRAWESWAELDAVVDHELVEVMVDRADTLVGAVASLQEAAGTELARRDTGWRELAEIVSTWVIAARNSAAHAPVAAGLKSAAGWLRTAGEQLRDDRLRPFATASAAIWAQLRQESSVELGTVKLSGTATRRRLELDVTIDGVAGAAVGVMSQGEFNALGLSLFLPRATTAASPFRFVVLDDPVQAMDPAKVDGLARVLAGIAATRQVVVFSHDDRLPESLRRLQLPATVLEVLRGAGSQVTLRTVTDPVAAHLDDARSLADTDDLPADLRGAAVAACCRNALEAACLEVLRRHRITRGARHEDVDVAWAHARTTNDRAALALFDDMTQGAKVLSRLNVWGRWAGDCFQLVRSTVHTGAAGPGADGDLVRDTARLVGHLRG